MHSFNFGNPVVELRIAALLSIGFLMLCLGLIEFIGLKSKREKVGLSVVMLSNSLFLGFIVSKL
jgi:hypothetical protein